MCESPTLRVLVVGATGLLGRALCAELKSAGHSVQGMGLHRESEPHNTRVDILDEKSVRAAVQAFQPTVIIHAAKMNVPEDDPDAIKRNSDAISVLAEISKSIPGCWLIYISCDTVYPFFHHPRLEDVLYDVCLMLIRFDGTESPYKPNAKLNPRTAQGKLKQACEEIVKASGAGVLRVPLLYGKCVFTLFPPWNFISLCLSLLSVSVTVSVYVCLLDLLTVLEQYAVLSFSLSLHYILDL
jgi:dTDP-4-dehydrorhamnose reductase